MHDDFGLYVFFVVIVGLAVAYVASSVIELINESRRKKRGKKLIEVAELIGHRFYCNIDHDVLAVCTLQAFTEAFTEHMDKVKSGDLKEWDKVVCYAEPLFTFAGSRQTLRPVHTGLKVYLDDSIRRGLAQISGVNTHDVSQKDYEKALSIIFVRDSRLFVPYAGNVEKVKEMEEQFAFYGKTTMEQALQAIKL